MSEKIDWLNVTEAATVAGCTSGWIRLLLRNGKLAGWRAGQRAWLVRKSDCAALRQSLGPLSNLHKRRKATTKGCANG